MRTILSIIFLFSMSGSFFAQENRDTLSVQIVTFPDVEAEFPGGTKTLMKYVADNIIYPEIGYDNIAGKIYISFVVNTDGTVSEVKIERGISNELDEMAKKLILNMPKWNPAKINGKAVRSQVRLPINICLN